MSTPCPYADHQRSTMGKIALRWIWHKIGTYIDLRVLNNLLKGHNSIGQLDALMQVTKGQQREKLPSDEFGSKLAQRYILGS
jgi:hypothetical protein